MGKKKLNFGSGKQHNRTPSSSSFCDSSTSRGATKKFNPRENLTVEQTETLNEFIQKLENDGLTPKERKFCDECCLLRYLRARDWDIKKANKLLRESLEWREEYKPELITADDLKNEASTGKMYRRGFDKNGRPVVFMSPGKENSSDYVRNVKLLIYTLERTIDSMSDGVEQMTWMIDFNGYSRKNNLPYSVCMEVLNVLSNQFPERLGACFMIDTPWIFSLSWKAISPFVNPVTKSKVHFVNGSTSAKEQIFSKHFDMSMLDKKYCGTNEFEYNHQVYWGNEIELDNNRVHRHGLVIPPPDQDSKLNKAFVAVDEGDWPSDVKDALEESA